MDDTLKNNTEPTNYEEKVVSSITNDQRKGLLNGTLVLSGIITGGAIHAMYSAHRAEDDMVSDLSMAEPSSTMVDDGSDIAQHSNDVSDSMSFEEAFSIARTDTGAGGIFTWRGNHYNTFTREEWDTLDGSERQAYFESIDDYLVNLSTDHQGGDDDAATHFLKPNNENRSE